MRLWRDLSISTKIGAAFALVFISAVTLGIFGMLQTASINSKAAEIRDSWLPSVTQLGRLGSALKEVRIREGRLIIVAQSNDLSPWAEQVARFKKSLANADAAYDAYRRLISAGTADEDYMKAFVAQWAKYKASSEQVIDKAAHNDLDGMLRLYTGDDRANFDAVVNTVSADADFNDAEGKKAANEGEAIYRSGRLWTIAAIILCALFCAGAGLAIIFGVARPIRATTKTVDELATGNLQVVVTGTERKDEIGLLMRSLEVFKRNALEAQRLTAEQDAERDARLRRQEAMDRHTQAFGSSATEVMGAMTAAVETLRRAAAVMTETARGVQSHASETANGASKSSADLAAVAAAVEQFTASVGEISRQVTVASEIAAQAVQRADNSQTTTRSLAEATSRIGDVVRLIDTIAAQTNLLALNATIEAARAGDAGKGFAVVAGEVKTLASQTAKATAEIGAQIDMVRTATDETIGVMNDIAGIIARMGEVSAAISAAVEEQSVTTREIAASVQSVAGATAQTAEAMQTVVGSADRADGASTNILHEATQIGAAADKLRTEIEGFLHAVRTDSAERGHHGRLASA